MDNIKRIIDLDELSKTRSVMLLGPRQTGKSWLIRNQLSGVKQFNLLQGETFLSLSSAPHKIREGIAPGELVVIDEIQRIPQLLNEVHYLIEEKQVRFVLTGSSARKIRKGGVNLLGGRTRSIRLNPLSAVELGPRFKLDHALNFGLLPPMALNEDSNDRLSSYVNDYIQLEIIAENAAEYGVALETYIHHELKCFCEYKSKEPLTFWRSPTGLEVDFLLGDRIAIEIKSTCNVSDKMLVGLKALREEGRFKHFVVVAFESFARKVDGIEIIPFSEFVSRLWGDDWS